MATLQRSDAVIALMDLTFDVVVIGAGMTGAGVALDAAARGLRVALIDRGDIGSGTSSKSSKMVHGGLRYLQQREFRLVYENLRERQRLLDNAPFLVRPLPFLIPLLAKNRVSARALTKGYATALRLYDLTGGWRIGQRYRKLTPHQALAHLPSLKSEHLVAAFLYMDARGDDARVALTLAKTAAIDFGATVANYVQAVAVEHNNAGRVASVTALDHQSGQTLTIATNTVVNATGVWADEIFAMAEHLDSERIAPAKGVHLSVARERLPADVAAVLSVPGDRRSIFVVPFDDAPYTFIGTTDTNYVGDLNAPLCTADDVRYLLDAVNASTSSALTPDDVTGVWAGLRPLLKPQSDRVVSERTADLSRRHQVTDTHDGVVHITGGKWTTYRQMAEDAVDALRPYLESLTRTRTKNLRLHGFGPWNPSSELDERLFRRYGVDAEALRALIRADPQLGQPMIEHQPYVGAEFIYAVRSEMARSLGDLLTRRTRAHLHDARATLRAAPAIAALVATDLGWTDDDVERELATYRAMVHEEFHAAGLAL